ncbi:MAG: hypothetical protein ACFFCM_00615 [Promethearchaeota archaeon]
MLGNTLYNKKLIEEFLRDVLEKPKMRDKFEFDYKAGHTAFHARVYLTISFNELVYKYFPRGTPMNPIEEEKRAQIQKRSLSEEVATNFLKGLIKNSVWNLLNCTDIVEPDTALLTFIIKNGAEIIFQSEIWESCRHTAEHTKSILDLLLEISPKKPMPP